MPEPNLNPEKNQSKKIVTVILVLLLIAASGAFIYKFIESSELAKQNQMTQEQLDQAYTDLDSMSNELDTRILKIAQLGGEIDTLLQIKTQLEEEKKALRKRSDRQIKDLHGKVQGYKELLLAQDVEIERLKVLNDSLMVENTELKVEANTLNESIKDLNQSKAKLEEKVATASKLKVEKVEILAISSSGKERTSPFKNRHIDHLKIDFEILENRVAPIEGKGILVKITGPDGNVIFDVASGSGTFVFEGRESFYTVKKDILFDRNSQSLTFLYNKGSDYDLGKYKLEVFTDDYKMGSASFIIK
ncbi:MAG: chromosome segregation protein SMC [Reichenbachiella sp.]|uniref:coiled-coil domain-containing protein n=1 Tax=Reichenbachiella sp. TaxID=2184521 RepID=UPI00329A0B61